jgi:hypothetical protein
MSRVLTLEAAHVAVVGGDDEARLRRPLVLVCRSSEQRKKQSIDQRRIEGEKKGIIRRGFSAAEGGPADLCRG